MARIAVGATLSAIRRNDQATPKPRHWIVTRQRRYETSMLLTLRCGRHEFRVNVPICHSGPCLMDVGLRVVAAAPSQRKLFRDGASHE
ncbi:hypothetical protein [Achromobacter aloeverae]